MTISKITEVYTSTDSTARRGLTRKVTINNHTRRSPLLLIRNTSLVLLLVGLLVCGVSGTISSYDTPILQKQTQLRTSLPNDKYSSSARSQVQGEEHRRRLFWWGGDNGNQDGTEQDSGAGSLLGNVVDTLFGGGDKDKNKTNSSGGFGDLLNNITDQWFGGGGDDGDKNHTSTGNGFTSIIETFLNGTKLDNIINNLTDTFFGDGGDKDRWNITDILQNLTDGKYNGSNWNGSGVDGFNDILMNLTDSFFGGDGGSGGLFGNNNGFGGFIQDILDFISGFVMQLTNGTISLNGTDFNGTGLDDWISNIINNGTLFPNDTQIRLNFSQIDDTIQDIISNFNESSFNLTGVLDDLFNTTSSNDNGLQDIVDILLNVTNELLGNVNGTKWNITSFNITDILENLFNTSNITEIIHDLFDGNMDHHHHNRTKEVKDEAKPNLPSNETNTNDKTNDTTTSTKALSSSKTTSASITSQSTIGAPSSASSLFYVPRSSSFVVGLVVAMLGWGVL